MAETRKNHLAIDGAKVKEDEHISSYKPIPEADSELRASKPSLLKSKEKLSADGAEEKLLQQDGAKVSTRVDMADAKYVVGDHRNGDANIELDANKRQFTGLTKEELMKFADDPFWVRLRWVMFALFWVLWLAMLAGAIAIIIRAPSCPPPPPKTWFEKGPLIAGAEPLSSQDVFLRNLQAVKARGMFVTQPDPYKVLDDAAALDELKGLVETAKKYGVKVIADIAAGFVSSEHAWFQQALNGTGEFASYFIWGSPSGYNNSVPLPPNRWISAESRSAWEWNPAAGKFYYQMHGATNPQLNFTNPSVVAHFDEVLKKYMKVGIGGVRLVGARELLVDASLAEEQPRAGQGVALDATMEQRAFWQQRHTSDRPALPALLRRWAAVAQAAVDPAVGEAVFTIREDGARPEQRFLQTELGFLRPPAAAPALAARPPADAANDLAKRLAHWPAIELKQDGEPTLELAALAALLPAAPVLQASLFSAAPGNGTDSPLKEFGRLSELRGDASIEHGNSSITAVSARNSTQKLLVCARWKAGHTGYAAVWNPSAQEERADLSEIPTLPAHVTVYYTSNDVKALTNYTTNQDLESKDIQVPALSTVVISYVPIIPKK